MNYLHKVAAIDTIVNHMTETSNMQNNHAPRLGHNAAEFPLHTDCLAKHSDVGCEDRH